MYAKLQSMCQYLHQTWHKLYKKTYKNDDVTRLSSHLGELLQAKVELADALLLIIGNQADIASAKLATLLREELQTGKSFTQAIQTHADIFDGFYYRVVHTGERSGSLAKSLLYLAAFRNDAAKVRAKIRRAAMYPAIIMGISCVMIIALLTMVVPKFTQLFVDAGTPMPAMTNALLQASQWLLANWQWCLVASFFIFLSTTLVKHFSMAMQFRTKISMHIPWFGHVLIMRHREIFLRSLALMLRAKLPIHTAVQELQKHHPNPLWKTQLSKLLDSLNQGKSLEYSLHATGLFSPADVLAAKIGQSGSQLDLLLTKQADEYTRVVEQKLQHLVVWLEPLLMLTVGVIIGCIVLAIYLPLFSIGLAL